ncbi:MAG: IS21 family transposase [Hydrogenibacillus schlegelii]|nr:IS21 family transposase [Hydrogenibacillus schlegelii]
MPRAAQAVQRFETLPGQQAQVDWAYFRDKDEGGQRQTVYAFVYLLSFSRFMYVEFTERLDMDTLFRCLLNAFEACGGVPKEVLFDNMKQVVLGRNDRGEVEWHPRMADFAALVGFRPNACRPRRAQTKGKVERLIRYVREKFLARPAVHEPGGPERTGSGVVCPGQPAGPWDDGGRFG